MVCRYRSQATKNKIFICTETKSFQQDTAHSSEGKKGKLS